MSQVLLRSTLIYGVVPSRSAIQSQILVPWRALGLISRGAIWRWQHRPFHRQRQHVDENATGGESDETATEFLPGSRIDISIADGDSPEAAKLLQEPTDFAVRHRTKRGFWGCHPIPWAQASVLAAEFVHARVWGILSSLCLVQKHPPLCRG